MKPVILIPLSALTHLAPRQLEAILLHELSHIRQYDYLVNLIINSIQTILYFNPFVKLFVNTIEREREKGCDELVIQFQYDPHGYASALLALEKNQRVAWPMAIAASGKKNELLGRVERILGIEKRPVLSFNRIAGVFAGLLCIIAVNAILILAKPDTSSHPLSFNQFTNPLFFFLDGDASNGAAAGADVKQAPKVDLATASNEVASLTTSIQNHARPEPTRAATSKSTEHPEPVGVAVNFSPVSINTGTNGLSTSVALPAIINANFSFSEIPDLDPKEQEHIREVTEISKKLLQDKEWKEVQKGIADVFTQSEQEKIRNQYVENVLGKIDWKKFEERLAIGYEQINWERVNAELTDALAEVRLDSVQNAFEVALSELNKAETWMKQNNKRYIPDTDLTIEKIRTRLLQTRRNLERVRAIKERKIIRL